MKFNQVFLALPIVAASTCVQADTLVYILDISGSTPVVNPDFMRATVPGISQNIARLPLGSKVKVFTVGDDKKTPINIDLQVQRQRTTQGDTAKELASAVPGLVAKYLNELRSNPERMQGESSLSAAFLDASKLCQPGKPCRIEFWTDGMEYQPGVIAWPKDYKKSLPAIPGLDLKGASIVMYGVGQGAPTKARVEVEQHWQKWLQAHKAGTVELRRL